MIEIKGLSKAFGERKLFDNFSLKVEDGEFVVFAGVSGCGKTTLLNMIGSLEPVDSGDILVDGRSVLGRRARSEYLKKKVGFLFQNFALVENKTVADNLAFVKNDCRSGVSAAQALETVGLSGKEKQKIYSLSGGEQQRVALARLIIKKCDMILADEPTGSLDRANANAVFSLLEELNRQGKTVIIVTHDEELQKRGKRVVLL